MTETVEPRKLDELPGFLVIPASNEPSGACLHEHLATAEGSLTEICIYPYYFYGISVDIIRYLLIFIYEIGYNKKKGKDGVCYVKKI